MRETPSLSTVRRAPRPVARSLAAALAIAATLAVATPSARAAVPAEALSMAWDDCSIGTEAMADQLSSCTSNVGSVSLYCAFSVAVPVDQVIGLELVVDLQHASAVLPDYWRLGPLPDCRHDLLLASLDFSAATACQDPGFAGALVQDYLAGEPRGLSSQARIKAVVFVPSPETRTISADTTYLAVRLALSNDRTVGLGSCGGCALPACLVFNSAILRRAPGAPGGDRTVTQSGGGSANWATWRGGAGANCTLVPVRRQTWGAIKSLYRP